jgi:hypothetical protein
MNFACVLKMLYQNLGKFQTGKIERGRVQSRFVAPGKNDGEPRELSQVRD